ncbi:hypothetical protein CEUSTIGMA_g8160.t1 [Chlamydomonas eustigma]|uniref:Uncharacterized protein n=1 Tax=Chlamydomonas eustigma TaxID=1157962 RepID=A0A250XCA6_9CHLO|nr:hypothetical protein CEUSTIGMA_g8160.t1 [Chlamydomonas eustigma]|eukprot:GAX80725.1 hypothetical protein CEUSTIGMA_g8160.t1 [Chlamydomonas eustigma]
MGQEQSTSALEAVDAVQNELDQNVSPAGIKLYKYVTAGSLGKWELSSSAAKPHFYDALEDSSSAGKKSDWFMVVDASDIEVHLDQSAGLIMDVTQRRLTFNADGQVWAMRFPDVETFKSFGAEMNSKLFYNTYGYENTDAGRAKGLGADYADRMFNIEGIQVVQPMDVDPERDDFATPEKIKEKSARQDDPQDDPIMGVVMGANDNSYLLKSGGKFDVLRNVVGSGVEDKCISFTLTPGTSKGSSRTPSMFTPSRVLLAQGERKMNLLTPDNPNLLHHADVETGQIVSTFSFQKDRVEIPIKDITHDSKTGQMEETSTFLGLDNNRLCRWDLRDAKGKVAESPVVNYQEGKDYSRGTNFNCMATSGDGFVVIGSQDGQVRLYSNTSLTMAKTSIPSMGSPITSVDVTYDGKWVVATSDHYLMVVKTTYQSDKGAACNAFTSRMGGRGSMPRLLRLKPEDQARVGNKPLQKGKFSWITESGQNERWIVASCGKYSVIWNFSKVKGSTTGEMSFGNMPTLTDYILTAKEEEVVDSAFQHRRYAPEAADASIVVATQHSLFNVGGA